MEIVTSAVVQEGVSGAISFVFSSRGEKVSQEDLTERLEMAHIKLHLGLERTRMMPVTVIPLLRLRKKLKDVFKECDDLLSKARDRQQVVPSQRRKIMHAVLPSFIVPKKDLLSSSAVGRFEWFAKEADKFVMDVESGCSLSHYRFLNPLIRHLLEGKNLSYHMVRGSQTYSLWIWTASVEEYGRVARLDFEYKDRKAPFKSFQIALVLRLYESTNIVGVTVKCLQSLGPSFKSLAEVATGELTQVPTQDVSYSPDPISWGRKKCGWSPWANIACLTTLWSPDPFCCIANGFNKPCVNNIISSKLTGRFPQDIIIFQFDCSFSAFEYCSRSSTDEARINTIKAWPPLEMIAAFAPHASQKPPDRSSLHQTKDGMAFLMKIQVGNLSPSPGENSRKKTEDAIQTEAIDCFIRHPEQTKYDMVWNSTHGWVIFRVSKPITTTRRASKRRR